MRSGLLFVVALRSPQESHTMDKQIKDSTWIPKDRDIDEKLDELPRNLPKVKKQLPLHYFYGKQRKRGPKSPLFAYQK